MTARFSIAFWVVVAAQVLVLVSMVGFREQILQTGDRIVLQTLPVDPRSLMQGDYAILRYEIGIPGHFESADPRLPDNLPNRTLLYVTLERQGDNWQATGYHRTRPQRGELYLTGIANDAGRRNFGIGTYFIPEGTGRIIERAQDVKVVVRVDSKRGDAVIEDVLVDGVPFLEAVESSPASP